MRCLLVSLAWVLPWCCSVGCVADAELEPQDDTPNDDDDDDAPVPPPAARLVWDEPGAAGTGLLDLGVAALDGAIYVVGGRNDLDNTRSANVMRLTLADTVWTARAPLTLPRSGVKAAALDDGLHVVGGILEDSTRVAVHDVYDPSTDSWHEAAPLPVARHEHAAVAFDERLLVFGGDTGFGITALNTVDIYDPASDAWSSGATMPHPRRGGTAVVIDDEVWLVGGSADRLVDVYAPRTDSWRVADVALREERWSASATAIGTLIVIAGGIADAPGAPVHNTAEVVDTTALWSYADTTPPNDVATIYGAAVTVGEQGYFFGGAGADFVFGGGSVHRVSLAPSSPQ